jgi:tRNA G26 N,N-dimethylase Trm1
MASMRDTPVSRAISHIDSFCSKCIRRMMFNSPMWITPLHPPLTAREKGHMGQFSVKIMRLTGSVLGEN